MIPLDKQEARKYEILALGEMFPQYDGIRLANETIRFGGSVESLMKQITHRASREPLANAADRMLGLDADKEVHGYSLARALKAATERNWNGAILERRISDLISTRTGQVAGGFFVPFSVLARGFSAGTASEAGNLIAPAVEGAMASDPLRKVSALAGLGASILTGINSSLEIPTFNYGNDPQYLSEISSAPELIETTGKVSVAPRRVSAYMTPSRQAILQADASLDVTLGQHLVRSIMEQIEVFSINGDGTGNNPLGLRNTAGVGSVVGGANGAQLSYAHLADMELKPGQANIRSGDFSGYMVNSETRRWLRTTQRATGLPFIWENSDKPLLGYRAAATQLLPSNLTKGTANGVCSSVVYSADWSQMVIALFGGGVDVIVDRITLAGQGLVKITAVAYAGVGFMRPAAFSVMNDALTS